MKVFVSKVGSVRFDYSPRAQDLAIDVEDTGIRDDVPPGSGFYLEVLRADPSAPGGDLVIRFGARGHNRGDWRGLAAALRDALKRLKAMKANDGALDIRLSLDAFGNARMLAETDAGSPTGRGGPPIV
jgi:hypothetical protein